MMASQKVRPAALRRFFRTSTYLMYAFAPEKSPSLAGRNFYLAIILPIHHLSSCECIKYAKDHGAGQVGDDEAALMR